MKAFAMSDYLKSSLQEHDLQPLCDWQLQGTTILRPEDRMPTVSAGPSVSGTKMRGKQLKVVIDCIQLVGLGVFTHSPLLC